MTLKIHYKYIFLPLFLFFLSLFSPPASEAARKSASAKSGVVSASTPKASILGIKHWSNPDYTRLAITLDRESTYEFHQLKSDRREGKPSRVYLDIHKCRLSGVASQIPIGDGLLKQVRSAQYSADTVRVVIDLETVKDFKVFTFSDPFRIIIDFKGERREEIRNPPLPVIESSKSSLPESETAATSEKAPDVREPAPSKKKKIGKKPEIPAAANASSLRRIVIDPGHGGHDPGAIGKKGTKEKDVVLSIALELADILRNEMNLDVVLTRSKDVFIELQERTAIANKVGADLFVSVHANAAPNRNASGIETYYLNLAKTEKVAQLAAKENGTSLEKVSILQAVLFDLLANYKLNDSAKLADFVQKSLHSRISSDFKPAKNLGVKQGPFYVLVGASMPSILVETAFISNAAEEERLNSRSYITATAEGIAEGVAAYMRALSGKGTHNE